MNGFVCLIYFAFGVVCLTAGLMLLPCNITTVLLGHTCGEQWSAAAAMFGLTVLCGILGFDALYD